MWSSFFFIYNGSAMRDNLLVALLNKKGSRFLGGVPFKLYFHIRAFD